MDRGGDDTLREELAEDDASENGSEGSLRQRNTPGPFVAFQYPVLLLHVEGSAPPARAEVVVSLFLSLLGVGLLAAPRALARAGLLGGLLAIAAVAAASRQALLLLVELGEVGCCTDRPYAELGRRAFGPQGLAAVLLVHMLYAGGLLAAYLAVLADLLGHAASAVLGVGPGGAAATLPRGATVLGVLALCAPGALERPLQYSSLNSWACAAGVGLLVVTLLMDLVVELLPPWFPGAPQDPEGVAEMLTLTATGPGGVLSAACIFALHFSAHAGAIEVLATSQAGDASSPQCEMQVTNGAGRGGGQGISRGRPSHLADGGLEAASYQAYAAATALVSAVAVVGYLRFGGTVAGSVLASLSHDRSAVDEASSGFWDAAIVVGKAAYGASLVCAAKFLVAPCRNAALELFLVRRSTAAASTRTFRKATTAVLAAAGFAAWLTTDLSELLTLLGAWTAGPLMFVLPPIIGVELARQREGRPWLSLSNALPILLLAIGAALPLASFGGLVRVALSQPAGHRGQRVTVTNLANITSRLR